jgi:hypothetical protein
LGTQTTYANHQYNQTQLRSKESNQPCLVNRRQHKCSIEAVIKIQIRTNKISIFSRFNNQTEAILSKLMIATLHRTVRQVTANFNRK